LVYFIYFIWFVTNQDRLGQSSLAPKKYDVIVLNNNSRANLEEDPDLYSLPFFIIKNISFATDTEYLYLKYKLAGPLPENLDQLTKKESDHIKSVYYKMYIDENYFDLSGNKNPYFAEAELIMSPFGGKETTESGKIAVKGELIKGGAGYDYLVVRYPYYSLLINQTTDSIVFSSYSGADTLRYPQGYAVHHFENELLAADPDNIRQIKIDLSVKKEEARREEQIRY
jgi:hypothetical protein